MTGSPKRSRFLAALLLVLLAAPLACDAPTIPTEPLAYDPTALTGGIRYRWALGRTIAIYVDRSGEPAGYDIRASTERAASLWNAAARFREYRFDLVDDPGAADVVVHYRSAPRIVDVFDCAPGGSGAGSTVFCPDEPEARVLPLLAGGGGHVKVDIYADPLAPSDAILTLAGQTRAEYFVTLIAHELGHTLGIGAHSGDDADLMNGRPLVRRPSDRDLGVLRKVLRDGVDVRL